MENHTEPKNEKVQMSASQIGLLLLAKEGDGDAFARLAEDYKPMLDAAVAPHRERFSESDLEEISQEALLAFHRAVQSYEMLYGNISFGLYAKICVNNAIASALRHYKSHSSIVCVPIDEVEPSWLVTPDPVSEIIESESAAELRKIIRDNLSRYENSVWWMHYSGMSNDEIAETLNTSNKSVANALSRIRQKLRALLS